MEEIREEMRQQVKEMGDNVDFRIEALRVEDLRKDVQEVKQVANVQSQTVNKLDERAKQLEDDRDRLSSDAKKLEEKVEKDNATVTKKLGKIRDTIETLLEEKVDDFEAEKDALK